MKKAIIAIIVILLIIGGFLIFKSLTKDIAVSEGTPEVSGGSLTEKDIDVSDIESKSAETLIDDSFLGEEDLNLGELI